MPKPLTKAPHHVPHLINHDLSDDERERLIDITALPWRERITGNLRGRFPMRLRNAAGQIVWEYARYAPQVQHPYAIVTNGRTGNDGAVELSVAHIGTFTIDRLG